MIVVRQWAKLSTARRFCTARQPHCRRPKRAVASHHEGEWRHTPPRSKEGPAPPERRRARCPGRMGQMLHYAHTWLPLLSFALIAAVFCVLASFLIGGAGL